MNIECVSALELTETLRKQWRALQQQNPALASPHFSVELVEHVAAARSGVHIAVLRDGNAVQGFIPFHRSEHNVATPVADRLSSFQGAVVAAETRFDLRTLVRACRLRGWTFFDWILEQADIGSCCVIQAHSPILDLRDGFDGYCRAKRKAGSDEIQNLLRKMRKAEREIGPLRLETNVRDASLLDTLLTWKAKQLAARQQPTAIDRPWQIALMRRLLEHRSPQCAGLLSALYAGDELLAGSLGVRSSKVLSGWVTAYNVDWARYSPGLLMLLALARDAASLGVERIELGRGPESYKQILKNGDITVGEGAVYARRSAEVLHNAALRTREWVRGTCWGQPAQALVRRLRYQLGRHSSVPPMTKEARV